MEGQLPRAMAFRLRSLRSPFASRALLVLTALFACRSFNVLSFVNSPGRSLATNQLLLRRASATPSSSEKVEVSKPKNASGDKEIDDAVLRMAMAMSDEEDGTATTPTKTEKKQEEEGFDFNILITLFWVSLIIYSFGSSIIGVSQGRIQDRTGGDFTLYDFFDNIFSFSEWNLEYSLGFDPFKLFDSLKNGGTPPS